MKPKELFGVAVRVMGLGLMLVGICQILLTIVTMTITSSSGTGFFYSILYAGIFIGLGFVLMKCAPAIERFFYPNGE